MKKIVRQAVMAALFTMLLTVSAFAAEDILKVGLYYGNNALFSANLENYTGSGYRVGWYDEDSRDFCEIGYLPETQISMTADETIYIRNGNYDRTGSMGDEVIGGCHVQLFDTFETFEEAAYVAAQFRSGFPAYVGGEYQVRVGSFQSLAEAEVMAATYSTYTWESMDGEVHGFSGVGVGSSSTGVLITVTKSNRILFYFDCYGARNLGIQPESGFEKSVTWFRGYKWNGGFEYRRSTGGNINVINVVPLEDYVKGVLPWEMSVSWPLEALKAQAVCARTYALLPSRHYRSYGFDVCNTTDCQVYRGISKNSALTDQAVDETEGIVAVYGGELAETYYCSSNGGATESVENVWNKALPYLVGKEDPYEETISIPGYRYQVTYTFEQLTEMLRKKDYSIGRVNGAYVSRRTPTGNVAEVTFTDTSGRSVRVTGEKCKTVFYTTMFGDTKSVKSMRFNISGGGQGLSVNEGSSIPTARGVYAISGTGSPVKLDGEVSVITSAGVETLKENSSGRGSDGITIVGQGSGHNIGMSQYGARAMAELGMSYEDILTFYFTGISLEKVGYRY